MCGDFLRLMEFCCASCFRFPLSPALELIRNAIGSAQMLMSQKVQQFFRLCQQSVVSMSERVYVCLCVCLIVCVLIIGVCVCIVFVCACVCVCV